MQSISTFALASTRDRSAQGIGKALSDGLHIALPSATRDWCAPGVDAAKRNGATPLYIAAQKGHLEILCALMESRAGVDASKGDGATPLYIAEQKEHLEVLRALLESRADVDAAREDLYLTGYMRDDSHCGQC